MSDLNKLIYIRPFFSVIWPYYKAAHYIYIRYYNFWVFFLKRKHQTKKSQNYKALALIYRFVKKWKRSKKLYFLIIQKSQFSFLGYNQTITLNNLKNWLLEFENLFENCFTESRLMSYGDFYREWLFCKLFLYLKLL